MTNPTNDSLRQPLRIRAIVNALPAALMGLGLLFGAANAYSADDATTAIGERLGTMLSDSGSTGTGALEAVDPSDKTIRVRGADDRKRRSGGGSSGDLQVSIRTQESSYRVDEPVSFEVKGNKTFFLYLFNVDPRTERVVTILPNQKQTNRQLKYPGDNRWRRVPNPDVEFYSDRSGTERIVMVASEKYLDVDKLLRRTGTKALGDSLYESADALDWLDAALNDAYPASAEKGMEPKRIRVRDGGSGSRALPSGVVIDELNLRIRR